MKAIKIIAAVLSAALLIGSVSLSVSAAVTDEQKKEITDALFESAWNGDLDITYWQMTRSTVPIEDNPLAAMTYMRIEAEVAIANDKLLNQLYNGEIGIGDFYEQDDYDYTKAKQIDKYKNSMLVGDEFGYTDYQNGTWEFESNIDYETFYGYFREDAENFKLYDNETNELLGTYPRLLDYGYLDDESSVGGSNGSTGSAEDNEKIVSENTSTDSNSSRTASTGSRSYAVPTYPIDSAVTSGESAATATESYSRYDTDNPAVTPEIVSAVDAMKSNAEKGSGESITTVKPAPEKSSNSNIIILIVAVVIVGGAAFVFIKKNKNSSSQK